MTTKSSAGQPVEALLFDVFGTVVDWRASLLKWFERFGRERGRTADWAALVDVWRAAYQPSMEPIRRGVRPFVTLDVLHRESLDVLLQTFGLSDVDEPDRQAMVRAWRLLDAWPDSVPGLERLKHAYVIATLSNGGVALLVDIAKYAGLPWDTVLSADLFGQYKPDSLVYRRAAELLARPSSAVMMVAAHASDLAAARACGLKTAFVARPAEYGPRQPQIPASTETWDIAATNIIDLADQLGA